MPFGPSTPSLCPPPPRRRRPFPDPPPPPDSCLSWRSCLGRGAVWRGDGGLAQGWLGRTMKGSEMERDGFYTCVRRASGRDGGRDDDGGEMVVLRRETKERMKWG
ncbi:hypothetical protein MRB53_014380 [Persea americana]|uniref:Uncharacterized protein n=1 Tax=Persea americana TaxID=3435 RepID=A0ACC2KB74_PERAE|nr:hypothetical protein MRB53_014380 [Persea americana]